MPIVTININNRNFKLSCSEGSEELLHSLAVTISDKVAQLKATNQSATFDLLLVLTVLSLQEEVHNLQNKLNTLSGADNKNEQEQFSETLSSIASYLETLAQKLGK